MGLIFKAYQKKIDDVIIHFLAVNINICLTFLLFFIYCLFLKQIKQFC